MVGNLTIIQQLQEVDDLTTDGLRNSRKHGGEFLWSSEEEESSDGVESSEDEESSRYEESSGGTEEYLELYCPHKQQQYHQEK